MRFYKFDADLAFQIIPADDRRFLFEYARRNSGTIAIFDDKAALVFGIRLTATLGLLVAAMAWYGGLCHQPRMDGFLSLQRSSPGSFQTSDAPA